MLNRVRCGRFLDQTYFASIPLSAFPYVPIALATPSFRGMYFKVGPLKWIVALMKSDDSLVASASSIKLH